MANRIATFIVGGVVGAVGALLVAPRSGRETRDMVADKAAEIANNPQDFGSQTRVCAQEFYQKATVKGASVVDDVASKGQKFAADASAKGQDVVESVQAAAGNAKPVFSEKNDDLRDKIEAARQRIAEQVAKNAQESGADQIQTPAEAQVVEVEVTDVTAQPGVSETAAEPVENDSSGDAPAEEAEPFA